MIHTDKFIDFLVELAQSVGLKILYALIILIVGIKLAKYVPKFISKGHGFAKLDETLKNFLLSFISIAIYVGLVVSVALILGVPATSFLTILASAGVAIGLALQGSLSNFAGGIMLLLFKPFKDGDYIEGSGTAGTVKSITIFYTTLVTYDNKRVVVPNGVLSNATIINYSAEDTRRNDLTFSVSYSSSTETVKKLLLQAASECDMVLSAPEPVAVMNAHADSAVEFILRVWTKSADYWNAGYFLKERVKALFDENGIEIPFPQIDVHNR